MRTKLQVRPLICSAQAVRGPDQTGWWSHVFVLGRIRLERTTFCSIHCSFFLFMSRCGELRMFDNLTSINQFFFGLRSVAYRKSKTESHGVCCRVQKKPNSGLIQADSG